MLHYKLNAQLNPMCEYYIHHTCVQMQIIGSFFFFFNLYQGIRQMEKLWKSKPWTLNRQFCGHKDISCSVWIQTSNPHHLVYQAMALNIILWVQYRQRH